MNKFLFYSIFLWLILTNSAIAVVIFETNFINDVGYSITNQGIAERVNVPSGWDGVIATGNSKIEVLEGEGKNGKPALKLTWDSNLGQPVVSLLKHLTGDKNTGYDELYIRYHIRLPDKFKVGDGLSDVPYWKWGRLWQNTDITPKTGTWTENRIDSFYVVWNFAGTIKYGIDMNIAFGANNGLNLSLGSAGGDHYLVDYYSGVVDFAKQQGHFQHVGNGSWDIDWLVEPGYLASYTSNSANQSWHTIEYHVKLATSDVSNDGRWEVWFDGESQGPWVRIQDRFGASPSGLKPSFSMPTAKHGSGLNFLTFFDNLANWNKEWGKDGVDGGIYVNDVVISTTRIGHDYFIGSRPLSPANLDIK